MRLFISVDLPARLTESFAAVQARLADVPSIRLTDPEQAHVTVKFLGDTDADRVADVEDAVDTALSDADVDPFEATVGGLGVFPTLDYISVVWVGFREGDAALTRLHEAIERETTAVGFDPEDHTFTPHVTLARMTDARGKETVRRVVTEQDPTIGSFQVDEVRLKESTLAETGPVYETVSRFSL